MAPEKKADLPVLAFASAAEWETWLALQPRTAKGLWLKLAKSGAGIASVSRQEAIDGALCHGWIDGQLDAFDERAWLVRFTPRRPGGKWSERNRARALALIAEGRMRPSGLAEVEAARADGRWDRAYAPQSKATVPADLAAALDAAPAAKSRFAELDGINRYAILHRVQDAKTPETRTLRIEKFVAMLERDETIYPKRRAKSGTR